jgi:hypothetical protein
MGTFIYESKKPCKKVITKIINIGPVLILYKIMNKKAQGIF